MTPREALLIIDMQVNQFDPAHPVAGGEDLLGKVRGLIARARDAQTPVVFVRHCGGPADPDVKGTEGWQLHPALQPGPDELVLDKTTCDTFESTALGDELAARDVTRVVIAGVQSDYCIRETSLGAIARGLEVLLVEDGHSTCPGKERSAAELSAAVNAELAGRAELVRAAEVQFGAGVTK
jgi:nicotinamidase-related amidase